MKIRAVLLTIFLTTQTAIGAAQESAALPDQSPEEESGPLHTTYPYASPPPEPMLQAPGSVTSPAEDVDGCRKFLEWLDRNYQLQKDYQLTPADALALKKCNEVLAGNDLIEEPLLTSADKLILDQILSSSASPIPVAPLQDPDAASQTESSGETAIVVP